MIRTIIADQAWSNIGPIQGLSMLLSANFTSLEPCSHLTRLANNGKNGCKQFPNVASFSTLIACKVDTMTGSYESNSPLLDKRIESHNVPPFNDFHNT